MIRFRGATLEAPICEFRHPETHSAIGIVGTMHVGMPAYYEAITHYVNQQETAGATVHYEYIAPAKEDWHQYPGLIEECQEARDSMAVFNGLLATHFGLMTQGEGLQFSASWQNHDISLGEYIRLIGPDRFQRQLDFAKEAKRLAEINPKVTRAFMHIALRAMPTIGRLRGLVDRNSANNNVAYRNNIALDAVDVAIRERPDVDLVVLWGPAHVPGLSKGVRDRGYKRIGRTWLPVLSFGKS